MRKIKQIIVVSFLLSSLVVSSQTRIHSPYSRYGLGELNFNSVPFISSMGGTSIGFRSKNKINFNNPASYSAFKKETFLFDASVLFSPRIIEKNDVSETSLYSNASHLVFAFPIAPKWGVSFGIIPYSSVGYKINDEQNLDSVGLVKYNYEGWGGLNNLYFGTGVEIVKGLSLGANMNYFFGGINRKRIAIFDTTTFMNTRINNNILVSDIDLTVGLQYEYNFKKKKIVDGEVLKVPSDYTLTIGLKGGNINSLKATQNIVAENFSGDDIFAPATDTVFNNSEDIFVNIPMHIGGGFSIEKDNRWSFGIDAELQNWSDFSISELSDSLKNTLRVSAGGYFLPKEKAITNMLRRSHYLWGVHYYNNYLELKNTDLKQYGISFGISMPIRSSLTALQFSFEIGKLGTKENNLINETYGKIKIGVSITEKWFHKRKFD